jgi:hypothetical protein
MTASEIASRVLSGQPRNSLQQQQESRRARGVVGKLDAVAELAPTAELTPKAQTRLNIEVAAFRAAYPQVIFEGEDGVKNKTRIAVWMKARNAAFTFTNLVQCINDIVTGIIFDPGIIGLGKYNTNRMSGDTAVRSMPSQDFDRLLKPYAGNVAKQTDAMTSEEYKRAHPEAWEDLNAPVLAMEKRYVEDAVQKFLIVCPSYIPTDSNRAAILKFVKDADMVVNQASLMLAFDELTKAGKMAANESVSVKVGSTTRTDFNG